MVKRIFLNTMGKRKQQLLLEKLHYQKDPSLHPGDIRVLEVVYENGLYVKNQVDCVVSPQ